MIPGPRPRTPDNPRECLHPAETTLKTPVSVTPTTTSYTAPPCRNDTSSMAHPQWSDGFGGLS